MVTWLLTKREPIEENCTYSPKTEMNRNGPYWLTLSVEKGTEHSLLHYWRVARRTRDREGGRDRARGLGYNNEASCNLNWPGTTRQWQTIVGQEMARQQSLLATSHVVGRLSELAYSQYNNVTEKGNRRKRGLATCMMQDKSNWVGSAIAQGSRAMAKLPFSRLRVLPLIYFYIKATILIKGEHCHFLVSIYAFGSIPLKWHTGPAHCQNKFCDSNRKREFIVKLWQFQ